MAYNYDYITDHNAKSYTPGRGGKSWDGTVVIHWWGDPNQNPTAEGVVQFFERGPGTSAHFVVSGTGRKVYHLVSNADTAWHAGDWDANCRSIGIECDPRCRDEDYDVVAEVLADLWRETGVEPMLYRHSDFFATACPGNYDLNRLNDLMTAKYRGVVQPAPARQPDPVPAVEIPQPTKFDEPKKMRTLLDQTELWDLNTAPNWKSKKTFSKGEVVEIAGFVEYYGAKYYMTRWSLSKGTKYGFNSNDLEEIIEEKPTEPVVENPVEKVADNQQLTTTQDEPKTDQNKEVEVQGEEKNEMSHNIKNDEKAEKTKKLTIPAQFKSRKFILAVASTIVALLNYCFNWGLDAGQLLTIFTPILAFIGVEGYADAQERLMK